MRRILICTGVLGGGTALTFAAAALAATILPGGTVVSSNPVFIERGFAKPAVPVPVLVEPDVMVQDDQGRVWISGGAVPKDVEAPPAP